MSPIEISVCFPCHCYRSVGLCNGLICITEFVRNGYGRLMYLWNLFTRKHKAVRRSRLAHKFLSGGTARIVVGFGFDTKSSDYKIVMILYCPNDHSHPSFCKIKPHVQIYSLSTDSWRSLECEFPAFFGHRPPAFLNGNLHWFVSKHNDLRKECGFGSIVLFNMAGEMFDEMALPEEVLHVVCVRFGEFVSALNDLLAVFIVHKKTVGHSICSVWVVRDCGVPESWTNLYTFEVSGPVTGFYGFKWNGELLMNIGGVGQIDGGVLNPITEEFKNLISQAHMIWSPS